jgi:hypothetical protein
MKYPLIITTLLLSLLRCSNFSTEPITVNTPILLGIQPNGKGGHLLEVATQNVGVGFAGYRLFTGSTEEQARTAVESSGIACSWPLTTVPNQGISYFIEVQANIPPPVAGTNRLCSVPVNLVTGSWVALRALYYRDILNIASGSSSNALPVP